MHEEDEAQARQGGDEAGAAVGKEGRVRPVTGITPRATPRFTTTWKPSIPANPERKSRSESLGQARARAKRRARRRP